MTVERLSSISLLEAEWRDLEARALGSVFQSWLWIETWLLNLSANWAVVRVVHEGRLIGLGVLAESIANRPLYGVMPVIGLHETPESALGKIAIEYNGFLCEAGFESLVHDQFARFLSQESNSLNLMNNWNECRFSGCGTDIAAAVQERTSKLRLYRISAAPYVELSSLFSNVDSYIDTLSKNTRHQLRRSLRLYESKGALSLNRPQSNQAAHACLERLATLHQNHWNSRGKPGAFSNLAFRKFHTELVEKAFSQNVVDLVEVKVADQTIGILYNFVYSGSVSSYQSGFSYDPDNRLKPGLVCHALAVSDYASAGLSTYRFLAGEQRYKQSLSNGFDTLYWIAVQRPDMRMRIENILRAIKARF